MVDHPHCILDQIIHYIKGYRSINKQFRVDSFLDWKGHSSGLASRLTHTIQTTASGLAILRPEKFVYLSQAKQGSLESLLTFGLKNA